MQILNADVNFLKTFISLDYFDVSEDILRSIKINFLHFKLLLFPQAPNMIVSTLWVLLILCW
jgi:hypothetical protein